MPLPLSFFNNNIDPILPSIIKPELYQYDEYQTYDLVYIPNIRKELETQVKNYFGFTNETIFFCWASIVTRGRCLIERFTPFDFNWGREYSSKLYNLFKNYAGTNHNDYLLGENHPKANLINYVNLSKGKS
jgi:hypothetical protein